MAARASSGDCYSKFYNARDKFAEDLGFVPELGHFHLPTNTCHHQEKLLDDDGEDDDLAPH